MNNLKRENKKIIEVRKENKKLRNVITTLLTYINDRKLMDIRNLDRAFEIESVHNINNKTPELSYAQTEGIINELKDSIVASDTLLNSMSAYKRYSKEYNPEIEVE